MELNQTSICYYEKKLAHISAATESADSIVPDTFPDIGRIVCAYGTAVIKDQTPQNDRLLVSGTVQTTVLYEPENGGKLRRLSVPVTFAHIAECEGLTAESICSTVCRIAAVDAEAMNSRKVSVSVQLCFLTEGYCKAECNVTESVELDGIECLSHLQSITLLEQVRSYPVTILDDIQLADAAELSLLHTDCTMQVSECRAMHGRIIVKGEAVLHCLAMQEDDAVRVLNSSTPFTQILELPEAEEDALTAVRMTVSEADCRLESDGMLSCTISAQAMVLLRQERRLRCIEDMYLPGKELAAQAEHPVLQNMPSAQPFTSEGSETLQTAQHVSHVIAAQAVCCGAKRVSESELQIKAGVRVLYLSDEQQLCAVQRIVPLTMPYSEAGEPEELTLSARATAAGERGLLLTVTANGAAATQERVTFCHISALEIKPKESSHNGVTLVLKQINGEERLWDIAKNCGTTEQAIRCANDLPAEAERVQNAMLLIPIQD